MRKRIPAAPSVPGRRKKKAAVKAPEKKTAWKNKVFLHLESPDPRLLDKEAYKLYHLISESGATVQGPVPLPIRFSEEPSPGGGPSRLHLRLFKILTPTEKTISLLEKLSLSGAVQASVTVEEVEDSDLPPAGI
jgi:ribosomal protein S10